MLNPEAHGRRADMAQARQVISCIAKAGNRCAGFLDATRLDRGNRKPIRIVRGHNAAGGQRTGQQKIVGEPEGRPCIVILQRVDGAAFGAVEFPGQEAFIPDHKNLRVRGRESQYPGYEKDCRNQDGDPEDEALFVA